MNDEDYERSMLIMIVVGVIISIADFVVMAFVVNKPTLVGYQNAFISAAGVVAVVAVVLWVAAAILRPKDATEEAGIPPPPEDESRQDSAES